MAEPGADAADRAGAAHVANVANVAEVATVTDDASADDTTAWIAAALADGVEPEALPAVPTAAGRRRALGWALKAHGYAHWHRDPSQAAAAAAQLRRLLAAPGPAAAPDVERELGALADWVEGLAHAARGQMAPAVEAFDRAAEAFRALHQPQPAAETQVPKIMALSMLGRHDAAAACAEATQRRFIELGDWGAAGKVSLNLGSLQLMRDDYPAAVQRYREAAVQFARVGDHAHSVMADGGLADALTARGDFDEALHIYHRARLRAERRGLPAVEATVIESVALLQLVRGRYREALAGLEDSRRRYEALDMPQHLANAEKQLADAYLALRLLPEALALYDTAIARLDALEMPDDLAWARVQRARTRARLGRVDEAEDDRARAAAAFDAAENPVGQATVALARAEAALGTGEGAPPEPAAAQRAAGLAADAGARFEAAGHREGALRAALVEADAWRAQADAGPADPAVLDRAAEGYRQVLEAAASGGLQALMVRARTGLGRVQAARGDTASAREHYEAAIAASEEQRRALPGDELRSAFAGDHLAPYRGLLRLALEAAGRPDADAAAVLDALDALDRMRARTLVDRLEAGVGSSPLPGDEAVRRPVDADGDADVARRARLHWLYRRTQRLDGDDAAPPALHEELRALERELLESARRARLTAASAEGPGVDSSGSGGAGARSSVSRRVMAGLRADEAVVIYGRLDDDLWVGVLRDDGATLRRQPGAWPGLVEACRAARFQLEALRHGSAALQRQLPTLTARARLRLQALHALLWAPVAAALEGARRVVVVPHGVLGGVPWAALDDGEQPIGERCALVLAPSLALAGRGLDSPPPPVSPQARALVVGDSLHLPQAEAEARAVAARFDAAELLLGADATLARVQAAAAGASLVHLACHGHFRADNPQFSSLALADAPLSVEAARQLSLRAGLVVLSACETGLAAGADAAADAGDELVGLVRAFLAGGASRVVASLWPVDDAITAGLMAAFYDALGDGLPPSEALRRAQRATRDRHPHPAHWAAFVLHGGW